MGEPPSPPITQLKRSFGDDFIALYDTELIQMVHEAGQRIVYHTCGGMMPILENIAEMKPAAKPLREKEQSNPACSGKSLEQLQTAA